VISNSMIKKNLPYKDSDLTPVVMIGLAPSVVLVAADAPYKDLKEFIAASRTGQGFHWATAGTGSTPHFVAGILQTKYGAKLDVVPYKSGSESITAVIGKQVEATSEASIVALPYITSGKLKALADTWTTRISAYPQLSTATEEQVEDFYEDFEFNDFDDAEFLKFNLTGFTALAKGNDSKGRVWCGFRAKANGIPE